MPKPAPTFLRSAGHWLSNAAIVGIIRTARLLPYATRVRTVGWIVEKIIGPLAGYRRRALRNLNKIYPDLTPKARRDMAARCLNNVGRTFIENYSGPDFLRNLSRSDLRGPGLAALEEAAAQGRPAILVTGHFGNYEAVRGLLVQRGYDIGGLYRNMANPYFNAHYVQTMEAFGGPVFPQGRRGTTGFVRHLKSGGQLVLLFDQHVSRAPALMFMGHPAKTAVSAAELALRYDAPLIPFYGIRDDDGIRFDCVLEAPVPPSDPVTMTQAISDSLAARIKEHPAQWFWVHRRWRARTAAA